ncbi:YfgM family protein [Microbulbifer hydrolyticus]|uniref:Ancillary SecYEG translocon subunit n=1 Tax=Microbulbifer hydrolyticus TaxID=48074 RepID=A0A6P1TG87_9GAMM|nr:tetratricopeptide repeat protein [Microbulbifer hydrolyticus]MBB5212129.1 putative negative regulator of RcsB-dependent stress response [Microbulbifer hydrolyticus]QHQ39802.1 tetratricopeptide repeat protein [Microbulbifer hydrolyticus]
MADHLTEEEQIESLKRWWKENGTGIVTGVVLALAGYFGWQWWQGKERGEAEAASNVYQGFVEALSANEGKPDNKQLTTAQSLARELKDDYAKRIYAAQASLQLAALAAEKNDLETAAKELQWVVDNSDDDALTLLAKRRLAAVKAARGETNEALELLKGDVPPSFAALYAETRGDILVQQGDKDAARAAYQEARAQLLPEQAASSRLLDLKIEGLGEAPQATDENAQDEAPAEQADDASEADKESNAQ